MKREKTPSFSVIGLEVALVYAELEGARSVYDHDRDEILDALTRRLEDATGGVSEVTRPHKNTEPGWRWLYVQGRLSQAQHRAEKKTRVSGYEIGFDAWPEGQDYGFSTWIWFEISESRLRRMDYPVTGARLGQILVPDVPEPAAFSCHEEGCLYLRTSLIRPRPADDVAPAPDPEFSFSAFSEAVLALPALFDRVDRRLAEAYQRSQDDEE